MKSFKNAAYKILTSENKPLHSKEITRIALQKGYIKTNGKTPWATMNAILITDINSKKANSSFIKTGASTFYINNKSNKKLSTPSKKLKVLNEEFVKHSIIKYLSCSGWGNFKYGSLHEKGVDIRAKKQKYSRYVFIETKGESSIRQGNEVGFIYSLGQILTRMKDSGSTRNYYGIGLPGSIAKIAIRRLPWQVAKRLLLTVYSVNEHGEVEEYSWMELKKNQKSGI